MAGLLSFPIIIISKNGKKCNFSARVKFRRNRFSHSKTPKHAQNWLFLIVFSFFLFLRSTFSEEEEGTLNFDQKRKCPLSNARWGGRGGRFGKRPDFSREIFSATFPNQCPIQHSTFLVEQHLQWTEL